MVKILALFNWHILKDKTSLLDSESTGIKWGQINNLSLELLESLSAAMVSRFLVNLKKNTNAVQFVKSHFSVSIDQSLKVDQPKSVPLVSTTP